MERSKNSENPHVICIFLNFEFQKSSYFDRCMQKMLRDVDGIIQK
mgnify:CR=1 FL=1